MPDGSLAEDFVESLAVDETGVIWIGYRRCGVHALSEKLTPSLVRLALRDKGGDLARSLLGMQHGVATGWYGLGLTANEEIAPVPALSPPLNVKLPSPSDRSDYCRAFQADVRSQATARVDAGQVYPLDDDWVTRGDWLGRYGMYWADLLAMCGTYDYEWGAHAENVARRVRVGPNSVKGEFTRAWVQWLYTADPRVLELPVPYLDSRVRSGLTSGDKKRREDEVDDNGENYPPTLDGPDLFCTITIPPGVFLLSIYDVNKDGHDWLNRFRDYEIRVRIRKPNQLVSSALDPNTPVVVTARISDFWPGVWKRFIVVGPAGLDVQISRNGSVNTILPAIMLNRFQADFAVDHTSVGRDVVDSAADTVARDLSLASVCAPRWYAIHERLGYLAVLGASSSSVLPASGMTDNIIAYRGACLYQDGEDAAHAMGLATPRDVELRLKWDKVTPSYSGNEAFALKQAGLDQEYP
jgi:hypothetical protein